MQSEYPAIAMSTAMVPSLTPKTTSVTLGGMDRMMWRGSLVNAIVPPVLIEHGSARTGGSLERDSTALSHVFTNVMLQCSRHDLQRGFSKGVRGLTTDLAPALFERFERFFFIGSKPHIALIHEELVVLWKCGLCHDDHPRSRLLPPSSLCYHRLHLFAHLRH